MTDDLESRLRQTLHDHAASVSSPSDAWNRYAGGNVTATRFGRDPRLLVALPAAAVAVAAALVIGVLVTRPTHSGHQVAAPRVTSAPSAASVAAPQVPSAAGALSAGPAAAGASGAAQAAGPPGGPVPHGFQPASATFVSAADGWVLGTAPCATPPCTSILRTRDGGTTWEGISAPPAPLTNGTTAGVAHLRFADPLDGWAYGSTPAGSVLYATHDGAISWHAVTLPVGGQLSALEAAAGAVHAVVISSSGPVRILSASAHSDQWAASPTTVPVGAGPAPHAQLVLNGTSGWVVEVDRTVVAGARLNDGAWTAWQPPCTNVQGPAVLAASSPLQLVATCQVGLWSAPQGEHLFTSHDGGVTFAESTGPADPTEGSAAIATPAPGVVVAGSGSLVATFDGGASWSTVYAGGSGGGPLVEVGFTTPTHGIAVLGDPSHHSILARSSDGGHTWEPVTFPA